MMNIGGINKWISRGGVMLRHVRPEIFTGVGIVGVVAAGVLACKATLKVEGILDESNEKKENIQAFTEVTKSHEGAKRELAKVQVNTAVSLVKLYAPSVALGACSVGLIVGGHRILRKENAALGAAVTGLTEAFKKYRKRVVEDQGIEKDREYRFGVTKEPYVVTHEDGTKETKYTDVIDPSSVSPYARFFDVGNPNWKKSSEKNLMFLTSQQNWANDILHARGHLFLNEVYDMLGFPRTEAGQLVGWVDGNADSFVDFGIYNMVGQKNRDFVNGYEYSILLDFNVDGYVLDLFNKRDFQRRVLEP